MDAINADCRRDFYPASRTSGSRPLKGILWVVMHDTEGGTAASTARYFHDPRLPKDGGPEGSAHLTVDDNQCQRSLANGTVPWAAPDANRQGLHIEQAAYAKWTRAEWLKHDPMLRRGAFKAAYHCHLFDLPAVFRHYDELRKNMKGITTHHEVTIAFPGPHRDHSDPGAGWPRDVFMGYVRFYYKTLEGV